MGWLDDELSEPRWFGLLKAGVLLPLGIIMIICTKGMMGRIFITIGLYELVIGIFRNPTM